MYKCLECGRIFEEPNYETICFEDLYGVRSMFEDRHWGTIATCPFCDEYVDPERNMYYGEDEDFYE